MSIKLLDTIYKLTDNADKVDGKHASDFATSGHTHSYLPLSGGTIAGTLNIKRDAAAICYQNSSGTTLGWLGITSSGVGTLWESDGSTKRTLLHSGNSSVSKSGETLTVKINGTTQSLTNTNTTYSAGTGLSLSGTTFSNSGVRSISTGSANGTISVNTNGTSADVAVKGLGSAAYTASTAYAAASHSHSNHLSLAAYSFSSGCLVKTDIPTASNTMITFRIEGNSYGSKTILTTGHFYNYNDNNQILNADATNHGYSFGDISVFCYSNNVYLWFKQQSNYQSFIVYVYSSNYGTSGLNRAVSISNSAIPSSGVTRKVVITPKTSLDSSNWSSYCAAASHTHSYAASSHTHSQYYDSGVSRTANTVLAAPNGSAGSATFRKLVAADIPTLAISKISGLQSALNGKSATGHTHSYLPLSGGTLTGVLTLKGELYSGNYALNLSNSNIVGVNSIIMSDVSEDAGEGIQFKRSNGNNDSIWANNGTLYFSPNGTYGSSSSFPTNYTVIHSGNYTSYCAASSHTHNYAGSSSPGGAATSALTISASAPQLAAAGESNNINIVNNANSSITTNSPCSLASITKAIRFRWYNDYWEIGSIRGDSNKSIGFGFTINNNNLRFRITSDAAYVGSSTVLHTGNWSSYCAAKSHNHSGVLDSGNSTTTTFAYSKAGLNYADYTWLAAWNGYELRAVNKSQFAQASHTHNYAASSHTHKYAGSSSAGGAATSANKLNTNAGSATKPVYFTNGVPTACTYGFNGAYGMPVVLAAGYIYKNSYTSTTWAFSGSYCPALTGGITTSVSGGVLAVTWTAASGRSRYIYGAVANMRTSGAVTSYTGTEYKDRSLGMYWLGTATSTTTTYIRAMSQGDQNNDTGMSYDEMWGTSSEKSDHCILSFSIIVIGYWT